MKKVSEFKIGDFRRIGAALVAAIGVFAPAVGVDFGPKDAETMVGAYNEVVQAGSALIIAILTLWSKIVSKE